MNIEKMRAFCLYVENNVNYHEAAKKRNLTPSGLFKQIRWLENTLGCSLVEVHGKTPRISKNGLVFYPFAKNLIALYDRSLLAINDQYALMGGKIRILTTQAIAALWMSSDLEDFIREHPDFQINVIGSDKTTVAFENADIAIGPKMPDPLDIFEQRLLTQQKMCLYASKEYVQQFGCPTTPEELATHRLIGYGEGVDLPYAEINWHLSLTQKPLMPFFNINSGAGLLHAVENGIGIGSLSDIGAKFSSHDLVRILPLVEGPTVEWYFISDKVTFQLDVMQKMYTYLLAKYNPQKP